MDPARDLGGVDGGAGHLMTDVPIPPDTPNPTEGATNSVLVIGAGLAGITTARRLLEAGLHPLILDKGRAPGGRMASRTIGDARFDHGAQHFGARSSDFMHVVDDLVSAGVAQLWIDAGSAQRPNPRYVGTSGMRDVVEFLARGLDVRTSVEVDHLERTDSGVAAIADGRVVATGQAAVVTPPVPQLLALLDRGELRMPQTLRDRLEGIRYSATLAVMAQLDGLSDLPDGHRSFDAGPIAWLADNQHKGISSIPAITVHSSAAFSAQHLEDDPAEWSQILVEHVASHLAGAVVGVTAHRWRYAEPQSTLDAGAVILDGGAPVVLAGEVFAGAKVEGAFCSGIAAADMLLDAL